MLFFDGALGLIMVALWIYCIIDVITTPDDAVRNLPKLLWLLVVVLLLDVGSIVWLAAGHPWTPRADVAGTANRGAGMAGASRTTARTSTRGAARASNPDDDEEFLAGLKARAEEQRRRAREQPGEQPPAD